MAMGLGAFTEGLQSGIKTRDQMDIAKEYKNRLSQENFVGELDIQGKRKSAALDYTTSGGSQEDFDAMWSKYSTKQDPALIRFGKWLGGKMGLGGQPMVNEEQGEAATMQPLQSASSVQPQQQLWPPQQGAEKMADGGRVDEERMKRSYGDSYVTEEEAAANRAHRDSLPPSYQSPYSPYMREQRGRLAAGRRPVPTSGGGIPEAARDLGRNMAEYFDDTREGADPTDFYKAAEKWDEADSARDYGAAAGPMAYEAGKQMYETTKGFAKDAIWDNPVVAGPRDFITGLLTGEGDEEAAAQQSRGGEYPIPEDFDPNMKLTEGVPSDEKAATDATSPAPARTNEQMAETAMDEAQQLALENLDYKQFVDQGMRPADLPQMPTKDWVAYRREQMAAMQMQGMNPSEALKVVDDMTVGIQMRGFQREATKAFQYMQTGQMQEAAMALSMAYQYFPNGTTVQFAQFDDPQSGQPVLVARGFDEETGEPTGKPMIVTAERLSVMVEQMQKPEAFRTWTKDNRELQMEVARHKETVSHNRTMEDIYGYGAETDRMNAMSRAKAAEQGSGSTFDASEQRQRNVLYRERVDKLLMDEGLGDYMEDSAMREDLAAIMARVGDMYPTASPNQVEQVVMKAFRGGMAQGGGPEAGIAAAGSLLTMQEGG